MRILIHSRTVGEFDCRKKLVDLNRLPNMGEYIAAAIEDGGSAEWHEVRLIVHIAGKSEWEAEVFCNRIGPTRVKSCSRMPLGQRVRRSCLHWNKRPKCAAPADSRFSD